MKDKSKNIFIFLFLFFLLPPNFIIIDLGGQFGIRSDLIMLTIIVYLTYSSYQMQLKNKLNYFSKKIIAIYLIIGIYLIISSVFIYFDNFYFFTKIFSVFIKNLFIGIVVFLYILSPNVNFNSIQKNLVKIAFIYSLFSLVLYFGVIFGVISLNSNYYESINETFHRGFYFGYLNIIVNGIPRNQSWFTEASQLGQFLVIPLFVARNIFSKTKKKKDFVYLITIGIAFILTFSLANYFAVLFSLSIYQVIKTMQRKNKFSIVLIINSMIFITIFYFTATYIYDLANTKVGTYVISKQASQHISDREDRIDFAFDILNERPFGDISYRESSGVYVAKNRTALGMLVINSGYFGLIFILYLFYIFWVKFFRYYFNFPQNNYLYIGFLAFFVSHWWYGDWLGYFFIFNMSLIVRTFQTELVLDTK